MIKIICDRCKEETVDFDRRDDWEHIETSQKGYGKLGDYYLCPKCKKDFFKFLDGGEVKKDVQKKI